MAALVVQSRFAGLKIEDEDFPSSSDSPKSKKNKISSCKKTEIQKKNKSNVKPQPTNKKKKSKQGSSTENQWEMWKQKDEELVDGNFESELHQAILLSKLDYEEKKDVYKQLKKEAELEKKQIEQVSRISTKKQKKKNVMSLDQFNDMMNATEGSSEISHDDEKPDVDTKTIDRDTEFFERIKVDTKNELIKDKIIDRVKHQPNVSDDVITKVHYAEALEKKNKEITALKEEIIGLKEELLTVKTRNKKLCNILGQGEMKDKAEVLVEVERLRAVQAELTAEISTLHCDLEKERSKNADSRTKDKKKKGANQEKEK